MSATRSFKKVGVLSFTTFRSAKEKNVTSQNEILTLRRAFKTEHGAPGKYLNCPSPTTLMVRSDGYSRQEAA